MIKWKDFPLWNNRILQHMVFWTVYVLFYGFLWGSQDDNYERSFVSELIDLPIKLVLVYLTLYVLMPRYLLQKRYLPFFGLLLPLLIIGSLLLRVAYFYYFIPKYITDQVHMPFWYPYRIVKSMVNLNSVVFFTAAIKLVKHWYQHQQAAQSLEKEKLEAELKLLKAQIHPHFLFNTLNNLYSLTLKKSDAAPEVVLKLSELMDYMLYQTSEAQVPLDREINYIRNYIALERIRYGNRLDLSFNVSGDIAGWGIAPMLLLPFIENSFKHGVSGEIDGVWVTIDVKVKEGLLSMKVENSKSLGIHKIAAGNYTEGIGLKNVKRRLELLYSNKHELTITDEETSYLVGLRLTLDSIHRPSSHENTMPDRRRRAVSA
ncbi:MAG: histidine kinase [Bacteroidota bacterium]